MGCVQVDEGRGSRGMGRWVKTSVQTFSNLFLKILAGAVTTDVGSLFQYFRTLTE